MNGLNSFLLSCSCARHIDYGLTAKYPERVRVGMVVHHSDGV